MCSRGSIFMLTTIDEGTDKYEDLTPDEVVKLYLKGGCSFNSVLLKYHKMLLKKSEAWVPGHDKEDLYQELAMKMYMSIDKWDQDTGIKFITYLYKVLDQHIAYLIRRELTFDIRRANHIDIQSLEELVENGIDIGLPRPEGTLERADLLSGISLTKDELICINLVFEGYMKSDIARNMGVPRGTITKLLKGLRIKLRHLTIC